MRASSHVLYLLSVVESTVPQQVYGGKLGFVSERTIKDIIICHLINAQLRSRRLEGRPGVEYILNILCQRR